MNNGDKYAQLWEQITVDFRQVCVLRRDGKPDEADYILNQELPLTIADWSNGNPKRPEVKKAELLAMFAEEQRRVDSAIAVERIVSAKLREVLLPELAAQMVQEIKLAVGAEVGSLRAMMAEITSMTTPRRSATQRPSERIKFDDIPRVIDAVLAEQQRDHGPKPAFAVQI